MVCDAEPARRPLRRLASTRGFPPRGDHGWLRVFEGLEPFAAGAGSKLVRATPSTTADEVCRQLGLGEEQALWLQLGGGPGRRVEADERPLRLQEQALAACGWRSAWRRARLAVDPELRHALRWAAGPAACGTCVLRSGTLHVLKGHVFPQWKPRPAYIIGSCLHMCGAVTDVSELSGGSVELCEPKAQRLVLRVTPRCHGNSLPGDAGMNHFFLGFSTAWERNLWFSWLKEATQSTQPPSVLDLSGGGRGSLPSALAQHAADAFTVRVLRLSRNALPVLPPQVLSLDKLTHLDLSENRIVELPKEMVKLAQLEELVLNDNELRWLDPVLRLPRLRTLQAARNLIVSIGESNIIPMGLEEEKEQRAPLTAVDLRHNRLKGSIILANYEHLVSLDLSHNAIEVLMVSALRSLRELRVSHNSLKHLSVHGHALKTLYAPYNELETLTTSVPPINLVEIEVSHNKLAYLPQWLCGCSDLVKLHASNNELTALPEHLFCSELSSLSSLHLAHNKISMIPSMPRLRAPLKELLLQDNCIPALPENFFSVCDRLCVLNLTNNRLCRLPPAREEKSIKETVNEYMKYVVLSAHRELKEKGQKKGASLILCHLTPINNPDNGFGYTPRRYTLRLANVGDTRAVLSRRTGPLCLGIENNKRLGYSSRYPSTVPDPDVIQTVIKEDDEFLILANGNFWSVITTETAVLEVRAEKDPIIAAKRLQDLAQSYGVEGCISVTVIRFDITRTEVDQLMQELRQTIGETKSMCRSDCCCSRSDGCCHSASPLKPSSDRSSPSGQSDRPPSEVANPQHYASVRSTQTKASERRSCRGGVARAIRVRVEEDKEEEVKTEERPGSEEQFKCWEYMLEQNTQMLFDKELDNLSKGIKSNVSTLRTVKGLSGSSPQLHIPAKPVKPSGVPFLSKHFGSARSFGNALKPDFRFGSGRVPNGGPNAAYFGSLQRLMPYHLEYDFAVIQEKQGLSQDSLDLEGRMQQYWGVATTEL
ncbi:hypothetical protein JYU34_002486 [Plutella xylostella]|uniref:PPM-type phosphatase domain-containing protein n=1 Tax=Plutella xylostella TaxID=51655 RepID=A0ABQ7R2H2_PLUXY|nr:hypothetical protein JYU34_002486 [Plutella xylostella]